MSGFHGEITTLSVLDFTEFRETASADMLIGYVANDLAEYHLKFSNVPNRIRITKKQHDALKLYLDPKPYHDVTQMFGVTLDIVP